MPERLGIYRVQLYRAKKKVKTLEAEVHRHISSKTVGGRVSREWLLRVFLAAPHSSARALAHSFRAVAGTDDCTVSRPTISKIKDAWVEMYVEMVHKSARNAVEAHIASAPIKAIYLVHVQDEAEIRLRSGDIRDGPSLPRRGRASKVQAHVVTLVAGRSRVDIPTELEALGDKTAQTLATSLESLLRRIAGVVLPQPSAHGVGAREPQPSAHGVGAREQQASAHGAGARLEFSAHGGGAREEQAERWVVHIIVGDGIPTNLAAAKVLWACVQEKPLGARSRYFVCVVKCGTHQAALSAKNGVTGSFAAAAGGELYKTIAGTAVRCFKYLINDYNEEFCNNVRCWVERELRVVAHGTGAREPQRVVAHGAGAREPQMELRDLYTSHVIPDEMMLLWNLGLGCFSHEVGVGVTQRKNDQR